MKNKLPNNDTEKSIQELYSENPNLVTIQKAAKALKVSKDTLRRWEAKGKISSIRTTSGYRLYELKTLIKAAKSKPETETPKPQYQSQPQIILPITSQTLLVTNPSEEHSYYGFSNLNPEIVKLPAKTQPEVNEPVKKTYIHSKFSQPQQSGKIGSFGVKQNLRFYTIALVLTLFLSGFLSTASIYLPGFNQTKPARFIAGMFQKNPKDIKASQEVALSNSKPEVLAASSIAKEGKFLQLNLDTNIVGNLAVEGEGVFTENLTAPNILYSLVAGDNITITGDAQNPTISTDLALEDATNTTKGIASFSSDFFTVTAGAVSIADSSITNTQIKDGTITNGDLANTSITITAGSGLSGGGTVALGGSITLSSSGTTSAVTSITGTANQIIASASTGAITLSLPQDIATTSSPTLASLLLTGSTSGTLTLDTAATTTSYTLTLPADDGTSGYVLQTDGSGNTSWVAQSGGASSLQEAYGGGNTITTTTGRNIGFTLASGLASSTSLTLTNAGTANAFILNDTNAASNISVDIQSGGTTSLSITEAGTVTTTGSISTSAGGMISSDGTLTASNGFTMTTGALSVTSTSGAISSTGLTALTYTLSSGTAAITAPTLNLNTSSTGNTSIGNATGTFALTSNGGLNVTTGGALTGVASIDTISTSATAITFAAGGTVGATSTGLNLQADGTIDVNIAGGSSATGCTVANSTGNLTCTGNITGSSTGTIGYWSRSGTTLTTATAGDAVTTTGNISTTSTGTITSAGLLTGSAGLTITGGTASINASGTSNTTIGNASGTFALTSTGLNVTTGGALTGIASIDTISFSATALTFAGAGTITSTTTSAMTLDSGTTGTVNLGTGSNAKTINLGTGNAGNTINIGTNNTVADAINIGSALDTTTIAGTVNVSSLTASSGVYTDASKNLTSTAPTSGALGYWSRSGTTLTTATASDSVTVDGTTTANGTFDANGVFTIGDGGDTGAISSTTLDIDATGALQINSSGGAISIGNDAVAQAINIGTGAAARTLTIGNATTTTALALTSGTGDITLTSSDDILVRATDLVDIGNGTDSLQISSVGDLVFVDADGGSSITGPAGGALLVTAPATALNLQSDGTIDVNVAGGSGATGCTFNNTTGDLTCSGAISGGGSVGYWQRSVTTLSPTNAGDAVTTSGNISTSGTGTITSGGTLTASNGFTQTTGALSLTATSGAINATGLTSATLSVTSGTLALATATSGDITLTNGAATGLVNVLTGNLKVGNGVPGVTLNGEDAYIEGTFEVDGSSQFDGTLTANSTLTANGTFDANGQFDLGDGGDAGTISSTTLDIDATGALQINSSGGAISIGNDAVAQAINIGTGAAARTLTIGNSTSTTALNFTSGTGAQTHTSSVVSGTTTSSAFVFNASSLTTGTALYVSSTATSGKTVDINASQTSGTIFNLAYGSAKTISGDLTGLYVDLNSGNVDATNQNITGVNFKIPTVTDTHTTGTKTLTGMLVNFGSGAGINQNGAGGTLEYIAGDFQMPALTQTAGTLNAYGTKITTPATITTGGTAYGNYISATGVGAGTLYGVGVSNITGGAGTEYAFNVAGTGWDAVLRVGSTTVINGSGVTQVPGGGTGLSTVTQNGVVYGNAASNLGVTAAGTTGQVLIATTGSAPSWGSISGSTCTNCLVTDPAADQTIAPTGQGTTGLSVRQTSTASPTDDIFQVTSSDGATKYFYVDKDGNVSTAGTSAQTLTLTPLTDTTALTLVGTNVTSQPLQYINSKNASATTGIINLAYGAAQTLTGSVIGFRQDLSTNVTATNQSVTGYQTTLPAATNTNTSGTVAYKGLTISGGALNANGTGGTTTYSGLDITIPALTQTLGTLTAYGANITTPSSITTAGTAYGYNVAATGVGAGTLYGLNISDITAGAGTEIGAQIGSGWDTNLLFNDTTSRVALANGGTLTILDTAGNSLCTLTDSGTTGDLSCTGTISGGGAVGYWSRTGTTLSTATASDNVTVDGTTTANGTFDANGQFDLGDGGDAGTISSTTLDIDATGALQINSSGGAISIGNDAVAQNINVGTGAAARTVTIGNSTSTTALAFNSGTGSQTFTSQVSTGTTTTSGFVFDATALTSGTGSYLTSDSITTGKLLQVATTGNTLTSGTLADIRTTSTALTGTAGTGSLINLDWTPGSSTTATGDLFALNIGANGSTTGNLFNILDSGSSIFSVSETSVTTSLPANFTSPGDVSIAYDLNFTNPVASFIKSYSALTIQPGDPFGSSNLTLSPYNEGSVYIPSSVATAYGVDVDANLLSTGRAVDISSTSTAGGASGASYLLYLDRSGANSNTAHSAYGIYSTVTNTNGTSGTNIAGYFSASGATTANYGLLVAAGNVGIGDTTPSSLLEVGDGTDSLQVGSAGDLTFVDANGAASITGPAGGSLTLTAPATSLELQVDGSIDVNIAGGSGTTGCTVANASGNLTCTGNITGSSSGTAGFWTRTGTTLTTATAADNVTVDGTFTTNGVTALGDGGDNFSVASNALDISTAGAITNATGVTLASGNFSSASDFNINRSGGANIAFSTTASSNGMAFNSAVVSTGQVNYKFISPAHINMIAEKQSLWATGATYTITGGYANQRFNQFDQFTISAGSALNISSEATTLSIGGAPIAAASATIANSYALKIDSGTSVASGVTNAYGLYVAAPTGASNNYAATFASGNVGIGDTSPAAALTVGSGDLFQVNSSGAIAAATGYTQASGAFAFSGGGNFSVDSAAFDVTTGGAVSGVTGYSQSSGTFTLTAADASLINLAAVNVSGTGEGLILPQNATACSASTAEGQVCWDTAGEDLYIGNGTTAVQMNGAAGGTTWNAITDPTGDQTLAFGDGEQNIWTVSSDTETFWTMTADSMTTGDLFDISLDGLTTGSGFQMQSTSTALTGTAGTGSLINLEWAPGSSTVATGDLFALNIGTNGSTTGNIFNLLDAGSSIFSVSETAFTTSLPSNFTSPGDTSMAYDLNFTNPTASYIKSAAPLAIISGETFNSSNLTLGTYNEGTIVLQTNNTTSTAVDLTNSTLTTGTGINAAFSAMTTGTGVSITSSGTAQTAGSLLSVVQSGTTTGFTGDVVRVVGSGTTGSGGTVMSLTGANTTAGTVLEVVGNTVTTTNGRVMTLTANALTSGIGLNISSSSNITSGNLVNIAQTGTTTQQAAATVAMSTTATTNASARLLTLTANSMTAGTVQTISSTATAWGAGTMFGISKTGATGNTAFTGDIANITYSHTFNSTGTLSHTGNVLDMSRALSLTGAATQTISGALMTISDSNTVNNASGTFTYSGDTVAITRNCTRTSGACTNSGNLMTLTSSDASHTGNTLSLADSATHASGGSSLLITASAITSGTAFSMVGPSATGVTGNFSSITTDIGSGGSALNIIPDFSGSAVTGAGLKIAATDSTANANTDRAFQSTLTLTGNAAKIGTSIFSDLTSSSTTADSLTGIYSTGSVTGILTTGTRNVYGMLSQHSVGAESTGGTTNVYGIYSQTSADVAAGGTVNAYGVYIANGTYDTDGTSTAYGLYVSAISGADTNIGAYIQSGVAIGDQTTTGYGFEVYKATATYAASISNLANSTSSIGLNMRVGTDTSGTFVDFRRYDNTPVGSITFSGGNTTAYNTTSDRRLKTDINQTQYGLEDLLNIEVNDYKFINDDGNTPHTGFIAQDLYNIYPEAVTVPTSDDRYWMVDYGKVTPLIVKSIQDLNSKVENALLTINPQGQADSLNVSKITVSGDVEVGGLVKASDYALNASEINRVGVLASLPVNQQNRASVSDTLNLLAQAANDQESRIDELAEKEASTAAALADAQVLGEQALTQTSTLQDSVASTSATIANLSSQIEELFASITGDSNPSTASDSSTPSSNPEDLALTPPTVMFASDSATLDTLTVNSQATVSGQLTAYEGIFQNSLRSLGDTFLGKTNIAGDLTVDGTFSVTEGSKVNALPVLYFQTSALAEAVDFFNGLVTITKDGAIAAKEIITEQISVKADSSAGTVVLTAGETEMPVMNDLVESDSIVILTSETPGAPSLAVADKVENAGFVVKLGSPYTQDIKFSYLIIGQK